MFSKILCFGAHTDDLEAFCGGTIAKLIRKGSEVFYVTFSFAEKSLPKGFLADSTRQESKTASSLLGVPPANLIQLDYEVRNMPAFRQEILENVVKLRNSIEPTLVLTHNSEDMHQDHKTIYEEVFRAFKQNASILGYESFKNNRSFRTDAYIELSDKDLDDKIKAISCYKSQLAKGNSGLRMTKNLAELRGIQAGFKYAECFEVIRIINIL